MSVPIGKLSAIAPIFFQVLQNVTEDNLDIERMKTIIRAIAVDEAANYESQPAKIITNDVTEYFLYGNRPEDVSLQFYKIIFFKRIQILFINSWTAG